jgi:hypothetical protein
MIEGRQQLLSWLGLVDLLTLLRDNFILFEVFLLAFYDSNTLLFGPLTLTYGLFQIEILRFFLFNLCCVEFRFDVFTITDEESTIRDLICEWVGRRWSESFLLLIGIILYVLSFALCAFIFTLFILPLLFVLPFFIFTFLIFIFFVLLSLFIFFSAFLLIIFLLFLLLFNLICPHNISDFLLLFFVVLS